MIEVEFNLMFSNIAGAKQMKLDIGGEISLKQLVAKFGIKEERVGMVFINKEWSPPDSLIRDGDFVQLYPLLDGG